jgi:hypothetical protein
MQPTEAQPAYRNVSREKSARWCRIGAQVCCELVLGPVKTHAGRRTLPLLDLARQGLKLQAERQATYRADMGPPTQDPGRRTPRSPEFSWPGLNAGSSR